MTRFDVCSLINIRSWVFLLPPKFFVLRIKITTYSLHKFSSVLKIRKITQCVLFSSWVKKNFRFFWHSFNINENPCWKNFPSIELDFRSENAAWVLRGLRVQSSFSGLKKLKLWHNWCALLMDINFSSVLHGAARCIFLRFQGHLTWLRAWSGPS